jgi:transcriptional regulator with PAS, ATPase and Fis domain
MAKQTAVEWFDESLMLNGLADYLTEEDYSLYKKLKQQAKEMEKQQIETAWKRGDGEHDKVANELSKKYYTETYGK